MSERSALLRETSNDTIPRAVRLPAFDALRASAAIIVFLFHYAGFVPVSSTGSSPADSFGWIAARLGSTGTNLLLLLSGFFIAQSVASGRFSYFRFVALRLVRIYIPYVAVLMMALAFARLPFGLSRTDVTNASLTTVLAQLLLVPGLFPDRPILTVTWTLSYIVAGYCILPLVGFLLRRWTLPLSGRLSIWAAVTALVFTMGLFWGMPSMRFAYIPAGCLLFEVQTRDAWRTMWPPMRLKLGVAALLFLIVRISLETGVFGTTWPSHLSRGLFTGSGLIVASCLLGITMLVQRREGSARLMQFFSLIGGFGRTGYSFYLIHGPVVKVFALVVFPLLAARQAPTAAYWIAMPFCWIIAAVAGLILYRSVELPSRQVLSRTVGGLADGR